MLKIIKKKNLFFLALLGFFTTTIFSLRQEEQLDLHRIINLISLEEISSEQLVSIDPKNISFCDTDYYNKMLDDLASALDKAPIFYKPEIACHFLQACNRLKNVDALKPRHLRTLKKEIAQFHAFLTRFNQKKRGLLPPHDVELIQRLLRFTNGLLTDVLCEENFDFDATDYALDILWHQPCEFVSKHKVIFITLTVVATLVVTSYYLWPELQAWLERREFEKLMSMTFENKNTNIDVEQIVSYPQKGGTCGPHALWNILHFNNKDGRLDKAQLQNFLAKAGTTSWLDAEQLGDLAQRELGKLATEAPHVSIVPDMAILKPGSIGALETTAPGDPILRFAGAAPGHREFFLVNTGSRAAELEKGKVKTGDWAGAAHWFTVGATKDPKARGGVRMFVMDSLDNPNRTNHPAVAALHGILSAELPVPLAPGT